MMKLDSTQKNSLIEFIARTISTMQADKQYIDFNARVLAHGQDPRERIEWELVHLQASWLETVRNLERLQKGLRELNDK